MLWITRALLDNLIIAQPLNKFPASFEFENLLVFSPSHPNEVEIQPLGEPSCCDTEHRSTDNKRRDSHLCLDNVLLRSARQVLAC